MQCWKNRPSLRNLNQTASGKPGAVQAEEFSTLIVCDRYPVA